MAEHDSDYYFQGPGRKRAYDMGPPGGFDDSFKRRKMEELEFSDDPDEPPATLRILVRNQAAGGIIGKGGDNIKRLRKQYDCQVLLPDSPGAPERVMTMMGTIESCVGVLGDVLPQLGEGLMREMEEEHMMLEVQVLIPQPFMGTIIGTGGTKIKELRTRTRTNIKIFSDPMPNSNERSIQLMGSRDQLLECAQYFLDEISKKEPREPIFLYEPMPMGFGGEGGEEVFPPRGGGRGRGSRGGPRGRGGPGRGGSFHSDVPINQWSSPQGGRGGRGGGRGGRGRGGAVPVMKPEPPVHGSTWTPPPSVLQPGTYGSPPAPPAPQPPPQFTSPAPPPQGHNAPQTRPPMGSYPPPVAGHNVGYGMNAPNVGYAGSQPNNIQPPTHMPPRAAAPSQSYMPRPLAMGPVPQAPPTQYRPPPTHQPSAPPTSQQPVGHSTQQVTIPLQYTDAIIGKNGANLQHIRAQSSCEIHLEELRPGATERIITITGTPNGIQFAQQLMQSSVRQHHLI